ncbi:hypothetical protein SH601_05135 [Gracilibacillus sp. S3-1-1]|uniref:Uncharacterized protein n=1 Tax=Gracilibacillus pellucidus TaxID=3095368 RepID=A0ACC6M3B0_9BACI|nr:hypothetical protein [Gracilibacillus sp. S3-1-1]MDX8045368.1 hypothetical protein [Gracilibacillus sp. S3-1-1]
MKGIINVLLMIVIGSFLIHLLVDNESVSLIVNISGLLAMIILAIIARGIFARKSK